MVIVVGVVVATAGIEQDRAWAWLDPVTDRIEQAIPTGTNPQSEATARPTVIDGDTLDVGDRRIRLFGIDAPESDQTCRRPDGSLWRCGQAATAALAGKVRGRQIVCDVRSTDRYGRAVAICEVGQTEVNRWLVREGLAVAYREYSRLYVPEEEAAQQQRRGIWATDFMAPSDWRTK
ncbi:thermonuclease family protein [Roseivivax sediminis]|uniref:thermonuclease family protein n=1 Tax=Roseivivax sediminis TaxID=936889 RepID=UPI00122C17FF